jgi:O-acetyl-ADP-ribose deacetylase (regulator of RNase III)
MSISVIKGDLIALAQAGEFEVIGHGCNCFCTMKRGIAPLMDKAFGCNNPQIFFNENKYYSGDIRKLGQIEAKGRPRIIGNPDNLVTVVNMYTQYHWNDPSPKYGVPLDEDAMRLCLRKMGRLYKDKTIALPGLIGCGLAGGNPKHIVEMIEEELENCDVKIVFIDESKIPDFLK